MPVGCIANVLTVHRTVVAWAARELTLNAR